MSYGSHNAVKPCRVPSPYKVTPTNKPFDKFNIIPNTTNKFPEPSPTAQKPLIDLRLFQFR